MKKIQIKNKFVKNTGAQGGHPQIAYVASLQGSPLLEKCYHGSGEVVVTLDKTSLEILGFEYLEKFDEPGPNRIELPINDDGEVLYAEMPDGSPVPKEGQYGDLLKVRAMASCTELCITHGSGRSTY